MRSVQETFSSAWELSDMAAQKIEIERCCDNSHLGMLSFHYLISERKVQNDFRKNIEA